jgi:CAAX protease family protein
VIGGFGPMAAAASIISRTGGSLSEWLRSILRWRVSWLYYAYALGLPVLLAVILDLALAALGMRRDLSLVVERIPAYLQTLLLTAVIFGGQEEPGWRSFALPRLQQRHPARRYADPRCGLGDLARTVVRPGRVCGAAGARLLLHLAVQQDRQRLVVHPAACQLHTSPDRLLLTADSPLVDALLLATYLLGAVGHIALTRGRLAYQVAQADAGIGEDGGSTPYSAGAPRAPPCPWCAGDCSALKDRWLYTSNPSIASM